MAFINNSIESTPSSLMTSSRAGCRFTGEVLVFRQTRRSRRQRVAALDGGANLFAGFIQGEIVLGFDRRGFVGQHFIFDGVTEPLGIIALPLMVPPGLLIDAVGNLQKQNQIL